MHNYKWKSQLAGFLSDQLLRTGMEPLTAQVKSSSILIHAICRKKLHDQIFGPKVQYCIKCAYFHSLLPQRKRINISNFGRFWSILRRICKISAVLDKYHELIFRKSSKLSPSSCRPPACSPSPSSPQMSSVGGKHSDPHDYYKYHEFQNSKRMCFTVYCLCACKNKIRALL